MNASYNIRQKKIYEDYHSLTTEKLLEFVKNEHKYDDSVIDVIKDILVERNILESDKPINNEGDSLPKQRHGCVTAWLVFMIVANAIFSILYLVTGNTTLKIIPESYRMLVVMLLILVGILNIYFASLLLNWKKSGFTGVSLIAGMMFFVNLAIGISLLESLIGLAGIFILYAILQIKKDGVTAWEQME